MSMERGVIEKFVFCGRNAGWGFIRAESGDRVYFVYKDARLVYPGKKQPVLGNSFATGYRGTWARLAVPYPKPTDEVLFERIVATKGSRAKVWCLARHWDVMARQSRARVANNG